MGYLVVEIGSCLLIMITCATGCYWGARAYFVAMLNLDNSLSSKFLRILLFYICGTVFATIEIPAGTFGPLWLCEQWHLIPGEQNATNILILLGAVALAISVWAAFRSEDGRRFSKTLRTVNQKRSN